MRIIIKKYNENKTKLLIISNDEFTFVQYNYTTAS